MIRIEGLFKSFGSQPVLRGASLTVAEGHLTYVLGPSGVGKSVLLKHILGFLQPDSGTVTVGGQLVSQLSRKGLQSFRKQFGVLFQNSALFDDLTVAENVAFPLLEENPALRLADTQKQVHEVLADLGLDPAATAAKFPNQLSGGMKKRVALARAIIRKPKILLYDEPTTGLDPVTRRTVDDLIEHLKRGRGLTSLVISHDIPSALRLADRIAFMFQGTVVFCGTPSEFRRAEHPEVRRFLQVEQESYATLDAANA